jgi:predicted patatin/cPLA2 family phospholipase
MNSSDLSYTTTAPSVGQLISNRAVGKSIRGLRDDPFHLALVIEGGGMRGVVSGGMVTAIEQLGLLRCFDTIHGSSAGACAGAYLAAGQAELGTRIYFEDINNSRFISIGRGLTGGPTMNADFLIDKIMRSVKRLDVDKIMSLHDFLFVVSTEVKTGRPHVISRWKNLDEILDSLRASIKIPIIAGKSVIIDGNEYIDGGVVQQIAIESALSVGATHIVVFVTRMIGELERKSGGIRHVFEHALLRQIYGEPIAAAYDVRNVNINRLMSVLTTTDVYKTAKTAMIVRERGMTRVGRLTRDARVLAQAGIEGRQAVEKYMGTLNLGSSDIA